MRIGLMVGEGAGASPSLDEIAGDVRKLEERGFHTAWMANVFGLDAIMALAVAGREGSRIEVGTAVVPTYSRHPFAMAQQALTAQAATGGRFMLGIGLSHKLVIEDMWGMSYDRPARHMAEYLKVLMPLLRGEQVSFKGEQYRVAAGLQLPGVAPPPVLVAALGPVMLNLTGRHADGTITWMTGPKTLETFTIPTLREAARAAGRPEPRVAAGFPLAVTDDVEKARTVAAQVFQVYGILPSYRAMLDREGYKNPEEIALIGDEKAVAEKVRHLEAIGVTDFVAAIFKAEDNTVQRTRELLAGLAGG
jgi:5,10-methylenetetrahydromethanopterin reductase